METAQIHDISERTEQAVYSTWRDIERLRGMTGLKQYRAQLADMRDALDEMVRQDNG